MIGLILALCAAAGAVLLACVGLALGMTLNGFIAAGGLGGVCLGIVGLAFAEGMCGDRVARPGRGGAHRAA